ncbi:50S ribosomal protein L24 [Candidatus Woesearchaeota archaeon]|nr:50S ribosomal protein L24 [Candidatus Woesearchaeota archaeon]
MVSFSTNWKSSKKPGKQRKYIANAPLHIKGRFFHAHLAHDLAKKYGKRSARVRTGDKVKIMKGQFKGKSGKVEEINSSKIKLYISGIEIQKKEGTKVKYPIAPSNVMITEFNMSDKKRQEILKRKEKNG